MHIFRKLSLLEISQAVADRLIYGVVRKFELFVEINQFVTKFVSQVDGYRGEGAPWVCCKSVWPSDFRIVMAPHVVVLYLGLTLRWPLGHFTL
jgi:hypothetical protein